MMTRASAIIRHGRRGTVVERLVISAMGSHLSGNVQTGRWRVVAVRLRMSVR